MSGTVGPDNELTVPRSIDDASSARRLSRPDGQHGFRPLPHRGTALTNDMIDELREDDPPGPV